MRPHAAFWRGRRVLLTGHTGFKGGWLALWLERLGAEVHGFALPPASEPSLCAVANVERAMQRSTLGDVCDPAAVLAVVEAAQPEVVFHLAAQPLVRLGYRRPLETFQTNTMGTVHLLEAVREVGSARSVVLATTDKVYQNCGGQPRPFRECDALGGHDPYSGSKAAAELVAATYRSAFLDAQGIGVATARAGNVIGGGDWSEDRLIPDAVRAWNANTPLLLRHAGAVRPWQHVLEPLGGYLRLAEALWEDPHVSGPFNFGPAAEEAVTVEQVIQLARAAYGAGEWKSAEPAEPAARASLHEAAWLSLEITKAGEVLGFRPVWTLAQAVERTMQWYRSQRYGSEARLLCSADIEAYEAAQ